MSPDMAYRHCSPIFPRIGPQTPSEGVSKTQKFTTPSEGVEKKRYTFAKQNHE